MAASRGAAASATVCIVRASTSISRVVPVAPARVALLVHYFQRPTNELPVPIARAREAAPLPQRLPLLLREQSVLLQERVEHL